MIQNNKFIRYFEPRKENKNNKKVLLLLLHGNSNDLDNTYESETGFVELGYSICSYSFRSDSNFSGVMNVNNNLLELVDEFKPDIIFLQLQKTSLIRKDILQYIKKNYPNIIITNWTGDVDFKLNNPIKEMVDYNSFVDYTFICSDEVKLYESCGCKNVCWIPTAFEGDKFHPLPEKEREILKKTYHHPIVFTGNNYGNLYNDSQMRIDMVNYLHKKFGNRFQVYGRQWNFSVAQPILSFNEQLYLYNSADIAVVIDNQRIKGYWSDRRLIIGGCKKSLILAKYSPNICCYFSDENHMVFWEDFSELSEKIKYYLNPKNKEEKEIIVDNFYNLVHNEYTWKSILDRYYLPIVNNLKIAH